MAYEVVMPYHLHMPSYFLETFTEYPSEEYNNIKEGILFSGCLFCAMMNLWEKEESLLEMKLRMHIRSLRLNRLHTYRK